MRSDKYEINNKAFPPIIETISISTQAGKTTEPSGLFLSDQLRQGGRRERESEKEMSRRKRFRVLLHCSFLPEEDEHVPAPGQQKPGYRVNRSPVIGQLLSGFSLSCEQPNLCFMFGIFSSLPKSLNLDTT